MSIAYQAPLSRTIRRLAFRSKLHLPILFTLAVVITLIPYRVKADEALNRICDQAAAGPTDPAGTNGVPIGQIDAESAIKGCMDAIDHDKKNARLWFELGRALISKKDYDNAIDSFSRAINYDPGY